MSLKVKNGSDTSTVDEAHLRTILDSMVEAVFVTDDNGRVTLTNRALDELVTRDVLGRRGKNVIKSKELKQAIRLARKEGKATGVELESHIADRVHSFHAQVSPLPDGAGVVTVLHDVTELKNADRIRRDFVANASHELRTPLTAVRGFAETLRDGAFENPAATLRFSEAIVRHTKRLQRLAEDLTVLSQAESPDKDYESWPTDVRAVCRECVSSLDSFAREKSITLRYELPDDPVMVTLSAQALDHVLINLIENAIKYSSEGGKVTVRVLSNDEQVSVEVADDGAGIPLKYHERIFERFYRVDKGRTRVVGGTGLGLSIARHLTRRLGGTIELDSELDVGSTFRVVLPLESANDEESS